MTTISGSTPIRNIPTNRPFTGAQNQGKADSNKIVIEIKPGENNVSSGDKSKNTAQVTIQTPTNEFSAEISREQAVGALERRAIQKTIQAATGGSSGNNAPLKKALLVNSGILEDDDLANLAYARQKQNQIDIYTQTTQNNQQNTTPPDNSSQSQSGLQAYNDAKKAYAKQTFIFGTIDRLGFSDKA
jgi:hypothetical protein